MRVHVLLDGGLLKGDSEESGESAEYESGLRRFDSPSMSSKTMLRLAA